MKKYYKIASIAIACLIAAHTFIPIASYAEEKNDDVVVDTEAPTEAEPVEEQIQAEPTEVSVTVNATNESEVKEDENQAEVSESDSEAPIIAVNVEPAATEEADTTDLSEVSKTNETATEEEATTEATEASSEATASETTASETEATEESEELSDEEKLLAELENNQELELLEAKEDEDFNSDGISDLHTKMLCEGEILTETGKKAFGDRSYLQVQQSDDLDCDGLKNGEEVVVKTREDGSLYAILLSDPTMSDTDNDGINDYDDTDKWHRGLYGGVLGNVRLVARHDDSKSFKDGHVYIVYTSYVNNLEISIDKLYGYYVTNPEKKAVLDELCDSEDAKEVSWRSTVDEVNAANEAERTAAANDLYLPQEHETLTKGTVVLNRGDYVSIGNYGMWSPEEAIANDYLPFLKNEEKLTDENIATLTELVNRVLQKNLTVQFVAEHYKELIPIIVEHSEAFVHHVIYDSTKGGVWINRELYNQKYGYDQGPNEVVEQDATADQLNVMLDYFSANSYFNTFTHNCTTVAAGAWNEVYGTTKDANGNTAKTDYYVKAGEEIHVRGYNPFTKHVEKTDARIDHPGAVKSSIKSFKDLPGYIGNMTYVTGKKLINTITTAVNKFDITKLFTKKTQPATQPGNTDVNPGNGNGGNSNSSYSNGGTASSSAVVGEGTVNILFSSNGSEDLVGEEVAEVRSLAKHSSKKSSKRVNVSSEEETTEEEPVEEAEEEIQQDSVVDEDVAIDEEAVPTHATTSRYMIAWIVVMILIIITAIVATTITLKKRK